MTSTVPVRVDLRSGDYQHPPAVMTASRWPQIPAAKRYPAVLAAACLLRLALFAAVGKSHTLERRPELTSPLTSIRSLSEGVYLYNHGIDPYDGGVFHHVSANWPS